MATNYTGTPYPGVGQDTPPPLPGNAPIVSVPADADPNNVATMFTKQYPILADHIAAVSGALRSRAPIAPSTATVGPALQNGFTPVTHVGPGAGTITFPYPNLTTGDERVVIKISTTGGLGVGFFQWSNDAGATYGVATLIPGGGTYTDGTSGITVTFAGAFTALDTYAFQPTDTPILYTKVTSGRNNARVSHDGSPVIFDEFYTDWQEAGATSVLATVNPILAGWRKWGANLTGAGAAGNIPATFATAGGGPPASQSVGIELIAGTAVGARAQVFNGFLAPATSFNPGAPSFGNFLVNTGASAILEFECMVQATYTSTGVRFFGGLTNKVPTVDFIGGVSGAGSLGVVVTGGSPPTLGYVVGTGVSTSLFTVSTEVIHKFRIEYHNTATPWGRCMRIFLDGILMVSIDPGPIIGTTDFGLGFSNINVTGAGGPFSAFIGRNRLSMQRLSAGSRL